MIPGGSSVRFQHSFPGAGGTHIDSLCLQRTRKRCSLGLDDDQQCSTLIMNKFNTIWDTSASRSGICCGSRTRKGLLVLAAAGQQSRFKGGGLTRNYFDEQFDNDTQLKEEEKKVTRAGEVGAGSGKKGIDSLVNTNEPASTGAFQKLPMVAPSYELIESALKRAERVGYNKKLKNEGARAKNRAARQLDTLMKELTGPLGRYETGFINVEQLHPFERALLELTVGEERYMSSVDGITGLRKSVVGIAKGYAAMCSKAPTKKEALDLRDEGFANVDSTYKRQAYVLDQLKEVAKSLRKLPVVDPKLPTIALVGAPNVGKSSLVQLLSSGLPEVQNYPFTTRSIKMGHFYVNSRRHQVTDTPGLLCRPEEDRNAMEKLTLASLEHLPTSVLFVMDLTGECGTSLLHQWKIRQELKERFPGKIWIDVFSKADLLLADFAAADKETAAMRSENENDAQGKLDAYIFNDELSSKDLACLIPDAKRVSSLTGDGIEELKADMLCMLDSSVV
eukprot:jgi/Picsp_1/2439/NSC_05900-R1_nucleolar gtp-binding protein 1-like